MDKARTTLCIFVLAVLFSGGLFPAMVLGQTARSAPRPETFSLPDPNGQSRPKFERALAETVRAAADRRDQIQKEIKALRQAISTTNLDTPLATRKDQAERLLMLLGQLEGLEQALAQAAGVVDTHLGTPVLRLVEIKPEGVPGRSAPIRNEKHYSVNVTSLPLEITPGVLARFSVEARQRMRFPFAAQCADPQYREPPENTEHKLNCFFVLRPNWAEWFTPSAFTSVPHALAWGTKAFARYCDYAPTYHDRVARYRKQVPFELDDTLQMTVDLRPDGAPREGAHGFRAEVSSSAHLTTYRFDSGHALFKNSFADARGYCPPAAGQACAELFVVIGLPYAPVVLHYRQVRAGEPYLASLPAYTHPSAFNTAPFVGKAPIALALPDLRGLPLAEAKSWLEENSLSVRLRPGSPAPGSGLDSTVERHEPAAGTEVEAHATVTLLVHSAFVDQRTVPHVEGRTVAEAKGLLAAAGLQVVLKPGGRPVSRNQAGTVQRQNPAPGSHVPPTTPVAIEIFGPFVETAVVPDLVGSSLDQAHLSIRNAGLEPRTTSLGPAPDQGRSMRVVRQNPPAHSQVQAGTAVHVEAYDAFAARDLPPAKRDLAGRYMSGQLVVSREGQKYMGKLYTKDPAQYQFDAGYRHGLVGLELDVVPVQIAGFAEPVYRGRYRLNYLRNYAFTDCIAEYMKYDHSEGLLIHFKWDGRPTTNYLQRDLNE